MNSQLPDLVVERLSKCGVVAVLVVDEAKDAVPLAHALLEGGIDAMELTLRTPTALEALGAITSQVPEMLAGIGTILAPGQVEQVYEAGAAFGVAPGMNPRTVQAAQKVGLPFAPGIVTPSDLELALEWGCRDVKFFPAEPAGGFKYLKSLAAPYAHLGTRFVPLGGLTQANMAAYLTSPLVLAVGGSWLAPRDLIQANDWEAIRNRASAARQAVDQLGADRPRVDRSGG
ncbi:MAG: bifunctional 4-hydroxy-2-oxoglutarate aldolase/2-dehydro-3-deoxy-phosphogluconate aldolase [Planctomycetota bacterium]